MKISWNWLRELVTLPADVGVDDVARRLTLAGLEVEGIERRGRDLRGLVVAEVRSMRPHPGAEKLRLVTVTSGGEEKEVVCGAPNVPAAGGKVCWAPPGAALPGGRTIERKEIRGVLSPGMLCSETEMAIGEAGDGILILSPAAPVGADVAAHLGLLDEVLEVNVTPNRPDALSHAGIAREVAALYGVSWRLPPPDEVPVSGASDGVDVQIREPALCPRYLARFAVGLRVAPSPVSVRVRLAACGVRAISNLVDATNYVLLETGHPLHAFDLDKLRDGIFVRRAAPRERMKTLDGVDRTLEPDDIVIADGKGPVALAGVMGGAQSEVSATTSRVLLEAATFDPKSIRRTAKRLGMHSEASHRFERGVDAQGIPHAAARAVALMARLAGGSISPAAVDRFPQPAVPRRVSLSFSRFEQIAGFALPQGEIASTLRALEIATEPKPEGLVATAPSFRPDIAIEEDLVEEVMRVVGLERAPARLPRSRTAPRPSPESPADRARTTLAGLGLSEVATWAFVPRRWLAAIGGERADIALSRGIEVKNPISADYEVMRTSLLPGLADVARRNLARGVPDPWLFEVGPVVRRVADPAAPPDEPMFAAGLLSGRRSGWLKPGEPLDFFDLRRVVDDLLAEIGIRHPVYTPGAPGLFLHPGVSAALGVLREGKPVRLGCAGEIDPRTAKALDLDPRGAHFYFEIDVDAAVGTRSAVRAVPPPRFPSVVRDISFWIESGVPAADQRAAFRHAAEPLLHEIAVLEDFRDPERTPPGKKGMLWSLTYRAEDRTLTDADADTAHERVVAALRTKLAVEIR